MNTMDNCGFETGTFANWTQIRGGTGGWVINDGTFDPAGPDGPLPPFAGGFSVLSRPIGGGTSVLFQDLTLTAGLASATLTWADRIRNHAPIFSANQAYRAEIQTTGGVLLQTMYSTNSGDSLLTAWNTRTFDLTPYIGQTIRVRFLETNTDFLFNLHLDNICVQVTTPTPTATPTRTATVTGTATATVIPTLAPLLVSPRPPSLGAFLDGVSGTDRNLARATAQAQAAQSAVIATTGVRPPSTGDGGVSGRGDGRAQWALFATVAAGLGLSAIVLRRRA